MTMYTRSYTHYPTYTRSETHCTSYTRSYTHYPPYTRSYTHYPPYTMSYAHYTSHPTLIWVPLGPFVDLVGWLACMHDSESLYCVRKTWGLTKVWHWRPKSCLLKIETNERKALQDICVILGNHPLYYTALVYTQIKMTVYCWLQGEQGQWTMGTYTRYVWA